MVYGIISQGIILYSRIPAKQKLGILDREVGKIDVIARTGRDSIYAPGTVLEYQLQNKGDLVIVSLLDPLSVPASWAGSDIYFLHLVLELCNAYLPVGQNATDIYAMLSVLYAPLAYSGTTSFFKKMFLCRLLLAMGVYPDEEVHDPAIWSLISSAGDSMLNVPNEDEMEAKLGQWLYRSLYASQAQSGLKTLLFLNHLGLCHENM